MDYRPRQPAASPESLMKRPLIAMLALPAALSAQEPLRLASEARLWLQVPAGQSPLAPVITALQTLRGVSLIVATTLVAEVGRLQRFAIRNR